ncbi:hypothetical protein DES40_1744 [Litorimonas taeanensis]|uniref:Uncharacterized protein n=1 Tax=Litorimonas taeanensis TaxID=568099 RepID=A0A420WDB5_9PROT|nr:hypothetical protein [Litorimonas taeanensis]RKQ68968.1 hypothetical protein DES40_1744 [Litorimonas taeanensis]
MNGPLPKSVHNRHRRALIKAHYTIADGYRLLAELEGLSLAIHICPVCHGPDISTSQHYFLCGVKTPPQPLKGQPPALCGAQGDVVQLVALARNISLEDAMDILESKMKGEPLCQHI